MNKIIDTHSFVQSEENSMIVTIPVSGFYQFLLDGFGNVDVYYNGYYKETFNIESKIEIKYSYNAGDRIRMEGNITYFGVRRLTVGVDGEEIVCSIWEKK